MRNDDVIKQFDDNSKGIKDKNSNNYTQKINEEKYNNLKVILPLPIPLPNLNSI